jgi:hypothetical protein
MSPLGVFELLTQADFEILHIWPSEYTGFRAILTMGNKLTRSLAFVGDALSFIYRSGNQVRALVRRRDTPGSNPIMQAAKISGATDWIARRRLRNSP